jgi:hypothetical protein
MKQIAFNESKASYRGSAHACSEIGLKWFLFFFCLSAFDLDLLDSRSWLC